MLTMTPEPVEAIRRAASRDPLKTPRVLTAKTCSQASSSVSSTGMLGNTPALLTQMSRPPSSATACVGRGADGCGIRDVHADADDAASEATRDVGCRVPGERFVDVGDRDGGAGFGQAGRDRLPEPAATAGDEGATAGERQEAADGRCGDVREGKLTRAPPPGARCAVRPGRARRGSASGCARTSRGRSR